MAVIKLEASRVEMGLDCQMKALTHTHTHTSRSAQEQKEAVHASDFRDVTEGLPSCSVQVERTRTLQWNKIKILQNKSCYVQARLNWRNRLVDTGIRSRCVIYESCLWYLMYEDTSHNNERISLDMFRWCNMSGPFFDSEMTSYTKRLRPFAIAIVLV